MIESKDLSPVLQNFLLDPRSSAFVYAFLTTHKKNQVSVIQKVEELVRDCIYGIISMDELLEQVKTFSNLNEKEISLFFQDFLNILGEEGLDELEKYPVNTNDGEVGGNISDAIIARSESNGLKSSNSPKNIPQKTLDRDPERVQSSLLNVLQKFNLHIDEQGIIAHEVERYLKGEILSKDLGPHMSALLDKPLSEINEIITALNQEIFKPIQKQIAEDGVLDISNTDTDLDEYIIKPKKGFSQITNVENKLQTPKIQTTSFSFIPEGLRVQKKPEVQEKIVSDLQTYGGTPLGTSLQSQEILDEQIEKKLGIVAKKPSKTYTIDPYREIPE